MIDDCLADGTSIYTPEELATFKNLLWTVDRLMDIINITKRDDADFVDCEKVNKPTHKPLSKLCEILYIFIEQKVDAETFKKSVIPRESYEGTTWIITSAVGLAWTYLDEK